MYFLIVDIFEVTDSFQMVKALMEKELLMIMRNIDIF